MSINSRSIGIFYTCLRFSSYIGPGLLAMMAECDAGNIIVAAASGASLGYTTIPLLLAMIPALCWIQNRGARLGAATGCGFIQIVQVRHGHASAFLCLIALAITILTSLVTQFTGIVGAFTCLGVSKLVAVGAICPIVLLTALCGRHRVVQVAIIAIGVIESTFIVVAWNSGPSMNEAITQLHNISLNNPTFLYLAAALTGATFNPWMLFYQQGASASTEQTNASDTACRVEVAIGATVAQLLTVAIVVLVASHANLFPSGSVNAVGDIAKAFIAVAGFRVGSALFFAGIVSASFVAAVVCTMTLLETLDELRKGTSKKEDRRRGDHSLFSAGFAAAAIASTAGMAGFAQNAIDDSVALQAINFALSLGLVSVFLWTCRDTRRGLIVQNATSTHE